MMAVNLGYLTSLIMDRLLRPSFHHIGPCFVVSYYSHYNYTFQVTYKVEGFLDKNSDLLFRDLSRVMFECEHPLLKRLFPEGMHVQSFSK